MSAACKGYDNIYFADIESRCIAVDNIDLRPRRKVGLCTTREPSIELDRMNTAASACEFSEYRCVVAGAGPYLQNAVTRLHIQMAQEKGPKCG